MARNKICALACAWSLLFISGSQSQVPCRPFEVASSNLREVVIGKCTVYQEMVNQEPFCQGNTFHSRNCTDIWHSFSQGFMNKPLCNVSADSYDLYVNLTNHPFPANKALFWENVYPFVHRFSNKGAKYFTLSDTLTGYIGNGLQWCSDPEHGMVFPPHKCPEWEPTPECPQSAQRAFWMAASKSFAVRASGEIQIMMDADTNPIFATTTYFAEHELPHLTSAVTKATLLLLNKQPVKDKTKCDDSSLASLANILKSMNIQYECVENRKDMAELYCLDNPQSKVCTSLENQTSNGARVSASLLFFSVILVLARRLGGA